MAIFEGMPENIRRIAERLDAFLPKDSIRAGCEYKPKATDIFVVGTQKTGTTWIQHIMHGLRSGGSMDFEEMSKIVPVLEYLQMAGVKDFYAPQEYQPNMFKCHLLYNVVPKGEAKHIIIVRNPADAAVSFYYYIEDWFFKKREVTLDEFFEWFSIRTASISDRWWAGRELQFIAQAYPHRHDKGVLWLHYEDLKADLKGCIKMISDFMEIGVGNQELLDLVEYQSSFEFMKKHEDKFDTGYVKRMRKESLGFSSNQEITGSSSKVRSGQVNEGKKKLSSQQLDALGNKWKELVEPVCGFATYEAMRKGINKELQRSF